MPRKDAKESLAKTFSTVGEMVNDHFVTRVENLITHANLKDMEELVQDEKIRRALILLSQRPSKRGRKSRAMMIATTFAENRPLSTAFHVESSKKSSKDRGTIDEIKKFKKQQSSLKKKPRVWQKNVPVTPLEKMIYTNVCATELCRSAMIQPSLSVNPKTQTSGSFGWPGPLAFDRADTDMSFHIQRFMEWTPFSGQHFQNGQDIIVDAVSSVRNVIAHPHVIYTCGTCERQTPSVQMRFLPTFFSYHTWIPVCETCGETCAQK
jgi:hypothetical protein